MSKFPTTINKTHREVNLALTEKYNLPIEILSLREIPSISHHRWSMSMKINSLKKHKGPTKGRLSMKVKLTVKVRVPLRNIRNTVPKIWKLSLKLTRCKVSIKKSKAFWIWSIRNQKPHPKLLNFRTHWLHKKDMASNQALAQQQKYHPWTSNQSLECKRWTNKDFQGKWNKGDRSEKSEKLEKTEKLVSISMAIRSNQITTRKTVSNILSRFHRMKSILSIGIIMQELHQNSMMGKCYTG